MEVSDRVGSMKYAIRDVQAIANQLINEGNEILFFNIGDPNKFDFDVPEVMQRSLVKYANKGYYSNSVGEESVRVKISEYEKAKYGVDLDPNNVIFTQGVSEGILYLLLSFCNPGDKILVPGPTYPAYQSIGTVTQVETVAYRCIEEENWIPDLDDLASKIDEKTKLVIIINPNNPTGAVYPRHILQKLLDMIGQTDAVLISDEIYDKQILDDEVKFTSISSLNSDVPSIIFNGFSKNYLAPGWRAAYMYLLDKNDKISDPYEGIRKLCRTRLSPNTTISMAAADALDPNPPHLQPMLKKIKHRRDLVVSRFTEIEEITTTIPQAAFYIFPKIDLSGLKFDNDREFVIDFVKQKKALLVHGSGFGSEYGKDHFRLVYLSQPDILEEGINRLADFINENKL